MLYTVDNMNEVRACGLINEQQYRTLRAELTRRGDNFTQWLRRQVEAELERSGISAPESDQSASQEE